jgi:hypothetical protein
MYKIILNSFGDGIYHSGLLSLFCFVQWLWLAFTNEHNRAGASQTFHLRKETNPVSETLCKM